MPALYDQIALSLSEQNGILAMCSTSQLALGKRVPINEARQNFTQDQKKPTDCFAQGKAVHSTDTRQRIRLIVRS